MTDRTLSVKLFAVRYSSCTLFKSWLSLSGHREVSRFLVALKTLNLKGSRIWGSITSVHCNDPTKHLHHLNTSYYHNLYDLINSYNGIGCQPSRKI